MGIGKSQLTGATGQYYVAYELSLHDLCATLTIGNAAGVDILVSKDQGLNSLSIQVKTSRNAWRRNRYGSEGYEWDVGSSVINKQSTSFWYALVNLNESKDGCKPEIFFVPSKWVAEFVKPTFSRKIYFLPMTASSLCKHKWENIRDCLDNKQDAIAFASTWPEDKLVRWGK
jgi:hypothetical protein